MSEGPIKNHEPSLPPLGLKQPAVEKSLPEETASLGVTDGKSLGTMIREARVAKGLSTADLAQSLNLDLKIVERLEADRFEDGPEPIYVRAYLKHWAGLVGADPQVWLQAYQRQHGGTVAPNKIGVSAPIDIMTARKSGHAVHASNQNTVGRSILRLLLILVALVVLLAVIAIALPGAWQKGLSLLSGKPEQSTLKLNDAGTGHIVSLPIQPLASINTADAPRAPATAPEVLPPPPLTTTPATPETTGTSSGAQPAGITPDKASTTPAQETGDAAPKDASAMASTAVTPKEQTASATPSTNLVIKVDSADCWVEVRDATGKRLVYDVLKEGEEKAVPGAGPFTLTLGNPSAVTVLWKGEPVKLGTPDSTTGVVHATVGGS